MPKDLAPIEAGQQMTVAGYDDAENYSMPTRSSIKKRYLLRQLSIKVWLGEAMIRSLNMHRIIDFLERVLP